MVQLYPTKAGWAILIPDEQNQLTHMGSWKSLNNRLYFAGKQDAKKSKSKKTK